MDIMKKLRVYIDTSVVGALFDTEDKNRVRITKKLLTVLKEEERYQPFISNILLEEVEKAPLKIRKKLLKVVEDLSFEMILENEESADLVRSYIDEKVLNNKYRDDTRHVALSVVNNVDFIVSWNCRHLANIDRKRKFNAVNLKLGYRDIDIITPLEVSSDE